MASRNLLALDVGEKRIGVSLADSAIGIAVAYDTLSVDGTEVEQISRLVVSEEIDLIVVGYPRNMAGEATKQTEYVEKFTELLKDFGPRIVFQDESLTSVKAEEILNRQRRPYQKADIDALAASLILQDYLEANHGRI
ncbi:MAG: Holliday junction resolvase RuvX [Candidatus Saccharimonas sp.]